MRISTETSAAGGAGKENCLLWRQEQRSHSHGDLPASPLLVEVPVTASGATSAALWRVWETKMPLEKNQKWSIGVSSKETRAGVRMLVLGHVCSLPVGREAGRW